MKGAIFPARQPRYPGSDHPGPEALRPRLAAGLPFDAGKAIA